MMTRSGSSIPPPGGSPPGGWWLPVVIVAASFFVLMVFETGYTIHDRDALAEQQRVQEPAVQEAIKLRQKLEALAGKTAQLAAEGDEGAKAIVDQMKRQGITMSHAKTVGGCRPRPCSRWGLTAAGRHVEMPLRRKCP